MPWYKCEINHDKFHTHIKGLGGDILKTIYAGSYDSGVDRKLYFYTESEDLLAQLKNDNFEFEDCNYRPMGIHVGLPQWRAFGNEALID